jgi:YgiT-type zinc finger domain-containing protein
METKLNRCVSCDFAGPLEASGESATVTVSGHTFHGTIPAEKCPQCGEVYTDANGHEAFARRVARTLIEAGEVNGQTFRFLRHTLDLTGAALAGLLGVAPDTVSRWERGERDVDRLAWAAVAGLVRWPRSGRARGQFVVDTSRPRSDPNSGAAARKGGAAASSGRLQHCPDSAQVR